MPSEPLTDAQLNFLGHHAEYGHFEGQDYDAVETLVAEVRRLRDVLHDLDDFAARHRGPSRFDHDHDCYESWMLLHDEVRTLLGDDDE